MVVMPTFSEGSLSSTIVAPENSRGTRRKHGGKLRRIDVICSMFKLNRSSTVLPEGIPSACQQRSRKGFGQLLSAKVLSAAAKYSPSSSDSSLRTVPLSGDDDSEMVEEGLRVPVFTGKA